VTAALTAIAFTTTGGADLGPNTWVEIALVALGFALAIAVVVRGAAGPAWGGVTLGFFTAFALLTAVSIAWSVVPDQSWVEAGRTAGYLGAFAAALALARLAPGRWRALIGGVALVAVVLSGWAVLVKVFPASLDRQDQYGRLLAPFDYWNATGLMAAMGMPAVLWAAARRDRGRATRAIAVPALALLSATVALSYSRSAVLAAVAGLAVWFIAVPLRLRGALMLGLGLIGGAAVTAWALHDHALTHDQVALAERTSAGHAFGLVLVAVLAAMAALGLAAAFWSDRVTPAPNMRRRAGAVLVGLVALLPLAGVVALAASSRGLTGEVSHIWNTLTSTTNHTGDTPGRLVALANSRPQYWSEGLSVGEHAALGGVGAGGFGVARLRYTTNTLPVGHAHSFPIETFADLGLVGLAISLGLLVAWSLATARTLRSPRDAIPPGAETEVDAERAGMWTLLCVVVAFGVNSAIDWTWFYPGVALPALVCAGWLAGRGPLSAAVGVAEQHRPLAGRPGAILAVTALAAAAFVICWQIWQPLRSADADAASIGALIRGDARTALADARSAAAIDSVSTEPLFQLSAIYAALGDTARAHSEIAAAVRLQPDNPETYLRLGQWDLAHHQPRPALGVLEQAHRLDLTDQPTIQLLAQARAALAKGGTSTGAGG
jgi:hypothetical protein